MPTDWQVVQVEKLPTNAVRDYMTTDVVTVARDVPVATIGRQMLDAHIHRVVVVDEGQRPIGVVSSTDILTAVAEASD
jgi:CBS domain-containing protein